ncbi:MAG: PaaI family thioesterase [Desulfobacterales bacterium]|nr:PaaI family thioesterase [Desulfobacterales bacterium]
MNRAAHLKPIPNREDHQCFACGPANDCGLKMKFFTDETAVFSWLAIPGHHRGWDRLVHGGITSTILDEIMSWSALYLLKKVILTKKMTVEFLHPIYVGAELRAEGRIKERTGPREAVMEGLVYNKAEILCARSEGSYALLEPKIAARLDMMGPEALEDIRRIFDA